MPYFSNFSFLRPDDEEKYGFQSPYRGLLDQPAITVPQPNPQVQGLGSIYQNLIDQPETEEHQAYLDWIKRAPKEADYQVGKGTRLAAVLSGAARGFLGDIEGGIQQGTMIGRAPYEKAVRQHEIEGRGLREVATLKRQSMEDRMQLLARMETSRIAQQNYELQSKNIASQMAKREIDAKTAQIQQEKLRQEMMMMGFKEIKDETSGEVYWKNPFTNQIFGRTKIAESIPEKTKREKEKFMFEFGVEQGGRERLQRTDQEFRTKERKEGQQFDIDFEGIRQENRKALASADEKTIKNNQKATESLIATDPESFKNAGVTIEGGGIKFDSDPPSSENKDVYAKWVAAQNKLFKGIPGAVLLTMPEGYDENGQKKATKKADYEF